MPILLHRYAGFISLILLVGCSDNTGPVTIDSVAGTYRLTAVTRFSQMEPLPIFIGGSGGGDNFDTLVSGSITLKVDGSFSVTRRFEDQTTAGATLGTWDENTAGTFTLSGVSLTLATTAGDVVNGRADGGSVTVSISEGFHWFIR